MEDGVALTMVVAKEERTKEKKDEKQQREDKRKQNTNKIRRCVLGKDEVESHQGPVA